MKDKFDPKTPHYNDRTPVILMLHGTGVDGAESHRILSGQSERDVSCHYLIDQSGKLIQYLDPTVRAWHAGVGYWAGFANMNSMSVGIEIECPGDDSSFDWFNSRYTDAQLNAVVELSKTLIQQYNIFPHNVLGHQDASPYRKADPGPHFDWHYLAKNSVGVWHDLEKTTNDPVVSDQSKADEFKQKLTLYGYDPRPNADGKDYSAVIRAFQTHFLPWNICGQVTEQSIAALDILLQKKFGV